MAAGDISTITIAGKPRKIKHVNAPSATVALAQANEKKYGVPAWLLLGQQEQESGFNNNATSPVGAKGAAQFMPATAKRFGIAGKEGDPVAAMDAQARYMQKLYQQFGSWPRALQAYNWGEGNLQALITGKPLKGRKTAPTRLPAETAGYAPAIMARASKYIPVVGSGGVDFTSVAKQAANLSGAVLASNALGAQYVPPTPRAQQAQNQSRITDVTDLSSVFTTPQTPNMSMKPQASNAPPNIMSNLDFAGLGVQSDIPIMPINTANGPMGVMPSSGEELAFMQDVSTNIQDPAEQEQMVKAGTLVFPARDALTGDSLVPKRTAPDSLRAALRTIVERA